jgi:dTMP kinase
MYRVRGYAGDSPACIVQREMETAGKRGGFFISFEGPEGSGKSTQIHRLAAVLAEQGHAVWTTREPGGTRVGETIRPILLGPRAGALSAWSEALLFTAARAQLVEEVIRPRLQRGELVLCDRYSDSTLAYQGYGRGIELESLRRLQSEATGGLTPDLTLLLDLPVEAGLARIPRNAQDRLDRETIAFHQRVHAGYHEMASREPQRWRQVDAARDPDEVASKILELVLEALRVAGVRPAQRRSA